MADQDTNTGVSSVSADINPATSLDNPDNWNFHDPETDGEIEEEQAEGTEGETDEQDPDEESETSDESTQEEAEEEPSEESSEEEQPDDGEDEAEPATITLPSGEQLPQEEVVQGYMRMADYTRKTQVVAEQRRGVEAHAEQLQRTVDVLADFINSGLPPEPEANLAYTDPNAYTAAKAAYEQQLGKVQELLALAETPKQVQNELTNAEHATNIQEENAMLMQAFPEVGTKEGREKFFEGVFESGVEHGFTRDEIAQVADHRILALAHYARIGKQAAKATKVAKKKVQAAPKASPKKQRKTQQNSNAMARLAKTGSMADALAVDFD